MNSRTARLLQLAALGCVTGVMACLPFDVSFKGDKKAASTGAVRGVVISASGDALEHVEVTAGKVATTTDEEGHYELKSPTGKTRVRFALDGYVDNFRSTTILKDQPTQLDVSLAPLAEAIEVELDAATGGMASGERGAAVNIPKAALLDASGKVVTGTVDVYLTALDPSSKDARAAAPELVALVEGDNQLLESLGILDLQIRQDDELLSVATGKKLEVSIPVPQGAQPEPTIDLWSFDEAGGVWVMEGKASFDAEAQTYVGTVDHLSLWSVDQVYSATCICGIVEDNAESPLAGARIVASGVSYSGSSEEQTDSNGRFCLAVRKDSDVEVAVYHATTGGQSKRIHTKSEGTLVPPKSSDPRCEDVGTWNVKKDASAISTN